MTEQQAIKAGLFIVLGLTLVTPAIAGIVIPEAIEDMGGAYFTLMFALIGALAGAVAAKIPKKFIRD